MNAMKSFMVFCTAFVTAALRQLPKIPTKRTHGQTWFSTAFSIAASQQMFFSFVNFLKCLNVILATTQAC